MNSSITCQVLDYNFGVAEAVGGLIQEEYMIICGGYSTDPNYIPHDKCFKMESSQVTEITGLNVASYSSAACVFGSDLFVTGGGICSKIPQLISYLF